LAERRETRKREEMTGERERGKAGRSDGREGEEYK